MHRNLLLDHFLFVLVWARKKKRDELTKAQEGKSVQKKKYKSGGLLCPARQRPEIVWSTSHCRTHIKDPELVPQQ